MKHHDLTKMFETLNDRDTNTDMARIVVYNTENGEAIYFAIGFGACDDDTCADDKLEQLADNMRDARGNTDIQELLEALPETYSIEIEGVTLTE